MSWIDDTLRGVRRRHASGIIEHASQDAFHRSWEALSEAERHALMEDLTARELFGRDVRLSELCFRCRLCETHTVRYVDWGPLQCGACKNTFTWSEIEPSEVIVE
ncbi:MAG: hypothetical protein ACOC1U_08680 [Spirochaetota bacterium]